MSIVILITGCSRTSWPDHSSQEVDNVAVSQMLFWPPPHPYTARGDTVIVLFQGLQRGFTCAQILEAETNLSAAGGSAVIQAKTRVELPPDGSCPIDLAGLDTAYRVAANLSAGTMLYLETPDGVYTDSTEFVSGTVSAETLTVASADTADSVLAVGPYVFHDSTAVNPFYMVTADSLPPCTVFDGAVYASSNDSTRLRFRLLRLDSNLYAALPPCAGVHADTAIAVPDQYGMPGL